MRIRGLPKDVKESGCEGDDSLLFSAEIKNEWKYTFTLPHALTLRRLMSYIYMEHPFLMFLDHTQRRSTVGRTPLDE